MYWVVLSSVAVLAASTLAVGLLCLARELKRSPWPDPARVRTRRPR
jgi:hypothetical protein